MSKKPVIVFEGIEGSGKSFHIDYVSRLLKKKKIDFIKIIDFYKTYRVASFFTKQCALRFIKNNRFLQNLFHRFFEASFT